MELHHSQEICWFTSRLDSWPVALHAFHALLPLGCYLQLQSAGAMFYADDTHLYISLKPSSANVALDLLSDFVSTIFNNY